MMYDFSPYIGKVKDVKVTRACVDERLLEALPEKKNAKVFFYNLSRPLCIALRKTGYMVTATLKNDLTK